jgi:signal transduction histidine kinase
MKPASWVCCATSLVALLTGCERAPASTEVRHAEYAVQWFGAQEWPQTPASPPANLQWRNVDLPYVGELDRGMGRAGDRAFARVWLRTVDTPAADAKGPRALAYGAFLPTGSDATLYVDGARVAATDRNLSNAWHRPVLFSLPYGVDAGRDAHVLALSFDCYVGLLGCAVPPLHVGPLGAVTDFWEWQMFVRIDAPRIGSASILIVGAFALLFWVRRRHEVVYALFFVASLLWTLRTLHYHLSHYPEPQEWFWWVTVNSLTWLSVVVYLFAFRLHGERRKTAERVFIGAAALATLIAIPYLNYDEWIWEQIQYGLQTMLSIVITVLLSIVAWRRRTREHIAMAVALWFNLALGVHDFMLQGLALSMERVFLLPYAALPLFGAFIYAMARRYRGAIEDTERLNASLEQRLAERTRELDASHAQLRRIEVESARHQERQRLMREMHDGLGSSLMSSLALAERGEVDHEFVLGTLREAVDELKLTIDSLEPIESDLVVLLGNLRYRLGPRLKKAGLAIEWEMPDLPTLPWMDAAAALQILRIVQESITNVIKHAHATRLRVATSAGDGHVRVTIADDGVGFDVQATARVRVPSGRGLRNLRHRAEQLGAGIDMRSDGNGTTLTLLLPIDRRRVPR